MTDVISHLLRMLQLKAHIFLHTDFCGKWAVDTSGDEKAAFHLIGNGTCWLHLPQESSPIMLHSGDLVVFPRDTQHIIGSSKTPPAPGFPLNQPGTGLGPATTLICGFFEFKHRNWNPILEALPEVIHVRSQDGSEMPFMASLINAIVAECEMNSVASDVVIDKLADVLFIHLIRSEIDKLGMTSNYLAALSHPKIGHAIKAIHEKPENAWSLESLASEATMSRSTFAEQFQKLVGLSPMQYLTRWRMQRAHIFLSTTDLSVAAIAGNCGYKSEAAFAKAFKKHLGQGPGSVRRMNRSNMLEM